MAFFRPRDMLLLLNIASFYFITKFNSCWKCRNIVTYNRWQNYLRKHTPLNSKLKMLSPLCLPKINPRHNVGSQKSLCLEHPKWMCTRIVKRRGGGESQLNWGGGLSGCKTIILATLVLSKISALLSHQDGLYILSHNMVTTVGQSSWLLILSDG